MSKSSGSNRKVAIVGATGAVGEVLLRVLESRNFPVAELRPLASERSVGTTVEFRGKKLPVGLAEPDAFEGMDFVFFAATGELSKTLGPEVGKRGGIAIDKSGTWRMHPEVPLVVPEVNGAAVEKHKGLLASPNCTTMPFVMALEPLRRLAKLRRAVVTTFQAVTGAGSPGLDELEAQQRAVQDGKPLPKPEKFARQIANNVVPLCETFRDDAYSTEEVKLLYETRKILDDAEFEVAMTCVRVPVPVGHSMSVLLETERPISPDEARRALAAFPGVVVMDDPSKNVFPTPADAAGRDEVFVGRIRRDLTSDRLWLWAVGDNLRKGAATNAVQIAEELMRRGLR
ncbi:MAG: aspartate-semialdehyde dehydrogenase [Deltaproteobacteria bacterium]|nr:aspartate-semialdehyde dehydrogenase [Deltaproteobacteria bacterium]